MLSIDIIRNNPKEVEQRLARKGEKLLINKIIKDLDLIKNNYLQYKKMIFQIFPRGYKLIFFWLYELFQNF